MSTLFMVIHVILAIALIVTVLLQRSDGGALGGLGGGSFGGMMTGRQSANLLTRTTAYLAAAFMGTSLILAILATGTSGPQSILDQDLDQATDAVIPAPAPEDTGPSAPVAQ